MNKKIKKVLRKIEAMEKDWKYTLPVSNKEIYLRSVPSSTGQLLKSLVFATRSKRIFEIGCSAGYSALWMASAIDSGHIYTTEVMKVKIDLAKKHFCEAKVEDKITLFEKDVKEILVNWTRGDLDFVFIDAKKEEYATYYDLVMPIVKKDGLIVADNMITHAYRIRPFLKKVKNDDRVVSTLLHFDNGLMLIYKKY